jgi:hypothetical protein
MKRKQKTLLSCEGIVCPCQQQPLQGTGDTTKEKIDNVEPKPMKT